jgi:hypothetical protein
VTCIGRDAPAAKTATAVGSVIIIGVIGRAALTSLCSPTEWLAFAAHLLTERKHRCDSDCSQTNSFEPREQPVKEWWNE